MRLNWITVFAAFVVTGCGTSDTEPPGDELLVRHIRIVSPEVDTVGNPTDVLIRKGRIYAIGSTVASQAGDAVYILDGTGRFLLPGLVDALFRASALQKTRGGVDYRTIWSVACPPAIHLGSPYCDFSTLAGPSVRRGRWQGDFVPQNGWRRGTRVEGCK